MSWFPFQKTNRIRFTLLSICILPMILISCTALTTVKAKQFTSCKDVKSARPLDSSQKFPGTLLFEVGAQVVALDGATLNRRVLVNSEQFGNVQIIGLSENGKWLGFTSEPPLQNHPLSVTVLSYKGEVISKSPTLLLPVLDKSAYGWAGIEWIGDQLVTIGFANINDPSSPGINGFLDPFTGEWQQSLIDKLPDKYNYPQYSGISLSPDLTRAMYVRKLPESDATDLVLWNITENHELWHTRFYELPSPRLIGLSPSAWSPDSSAIAFDYDDSSGNEKIFVINRDGSSITKVPNLSSEHRFFGISWSVNSRYLTFYAVKPDSLSSNVYEDEVIIYDKTAQSTTLLCSLSDLENDNLTAHIVSNRLIWSPDGQYLIYGIGSLTDETMLVIENVFNGDVRVFKPNSRLYNLIGWSSSAPWKSP